MVRKRIITGGIYHIYNRGVDKRDVFIEEGDRLRFVHYLYHCNDEIIFPNLTYYLQDLHTFCDPSEVVSHHPKRTLLVDIIAYALMPNHFHLMVQQRVDNGISRFMQRIGTGYTNFFNEKYSRNGVLFQGKYKYKQVTTRRHSMWLPHYIHMNPIDICGGINSVSPNNPLTNLLSYRWSSLLDYVGEKNFPSILNESYILELFGGRKEYFHDFSMMVHEKKSSDVLLKLQDVIRGMD